jgi:hypothetical protein
MTKAITDALGLPSLEEALKAAAPSEPEGEVEDQPEDPQVQQVANALQGVNPSSLRVQDPTGVEEHEGEADDIYEQAMQAHKDLMDLGFNVEPKHAGANAFMPALKAMEIALKASQSKAARKMERIKMVMDQQTHDRDMNQDVEDGEILDNGGQSITANRNDLLSKLRNGDI